jgi:hypothetical protein
VSQSCFSFTLSFLAVAILTGCDFLLPKRIPCHAGAPPLAIFTPFPVRSRSLFRKITAEDLSGGWVFDYWNELGPISSGPVYFCSAIPHWILEQRGSGIRGWRATYVVAPRGGSVFVETLTGTVLGNEIRLTELRDDPDGCRKLEYRLRFDPDTQRLNGTVDSQGFYAAPFIQLPEEDCGKPVVPQPTSPG